jgi:hypothetical protein
VLRAGPTAAASSSLLGLAGCGLRVGSPPTDRPTPPPPEPSTDDQALVRALDRAEALAASYGQAAVVRPDLAVPLRGLGADHAAHVDVLRALTAGPPSPTGGAGPAAPSPTALTALSVLSQSERVAAAEAEADLTAIGAQPARLLASVAACRSAHVALLARLPNPPTATKTRTTTPTTTPTKSSS